MNFILPSTETIAYQPSSPFARDIRDLMQSIIIYRESKMGSKVIIKDVLDFAESEMNSKLPKIVEKHTGIKIESIVFSKKPDMAFAISSYLGNAITTVMVAMTNEGKKISTNIIESWSKEIGQTPLTPERLKGLVSKFNTHIGKFLDHVLLGQYVRCVLYFDLFTAFLSHETINPNIERLTAEEITSCILHEIGHTLGYLEKALVQYVCVDMVSSNMGVNTIQDVSAIAKTNDAFLKSAKKHNKSPIDNETLTQLSKVNEAGTALLKDESRVDIAAIGKVLYITFMFMIKVLFSPISLFFNYIVTDIDLELDMNSISPTDSSVKYSDIDKTHHEIRWSEIYADQYVSQHGYGIYQVPLLDKLIRLWPLLRFGQSTYISGIRRSKLLYYYIKSIYATATLLHMRHPDLREHGRDSERIDRFKRDISQILAQANLSKEQQKQLANDYEYLEKYRKTRPASVKYEAAIQNMYAFILNHLTPIAFAKSISSANFTVEYTKLVASIESNIANALHAAAARLNKYT